MVKVKYIILLVFILDLLFHFDLFTIGWITLYLLVEYLERFLIP